MKNSIITTAALSLAGIAAAEQVLRYRDDKEYPAPGCLVNVDDKRMHIRICGEADKTLVFLPGLGTAVPSVDFMPLVQRLDQNFRCVIPEPFGYGWSDSTSEPRTVENIVSELRRGLREAGVQPPYILLGHSASGLYMRWWACQYPEEIEGLIGDDPSLPEQVHEPELSITGPSHGLGALGLKALPYLAPLGLGRARTHFSMKLPYLTGGDPRQLGAVQARAARCWNGKPILSEREHFRANAEAAGRDFPACPILVFVANGPLSGGQMKFKSGFSWVAQHEKMAEQAMRGKCVTLPGGHFLHRQYAAEMAGEIISFFSEE